MVLSKGQKFANILIHLFLILLKILMVAPFILLFMDSITDEITLLLNGYSFFSEKFSLNAYEYIVKSGDAIMRAYGITFLITILGTALNLLLSSMLAYGLSLRNLPGKRFFPFMCFSPCYLTGGWCRLT